MPAGSNEFDFPPTTERLNHWLSTWLQKKAHSCRNNLVILLCGGSGLGKSTAMPQWLMANGLAPMFIASMDHLQLPTPREQLQPPYYRDDPTLYRPDLCHQLIHQFRRGESTEWPHFDFTQQQCRAPSKIPANHHLLVEGLFAAHHNLPETADLVIHAEGNLWECLIRRLLRNIHSRYPGRAAQQRSVEHFLGPVLQAHTDLVRPQKAHANLILKVRWNAGFLFNSLQPKPLTSGPPEPSNPLFLHQPGKDTFFWLESNHHLHFSARGKCFLDLQLDSAIAQRMIAIAHTNWV